MELEPAVLLKWVGAGFTGPSVIFQKLRLIVSIRLRPLALVTDIPFTEP